MNGSSWAKVAYFGPLDENFHREFLQMFFFPEWHHFFHCIYRQASYPSPRTGDKSQIDATMERRICTAVLKQLDDNSNDVQTIAVKCLGALLRKVQEAQVKLASRITTMDYNGLPSGTESGVFL